MPDLHRRETRRLMTQARNELRAAGDGSREAAAIGVLLTLLEHGADLAHIQDQFEEVIASYRPTVVPLVPDVGVFG